MIRRFALFLALALPLLVGFASTAQACGDNSAKSSRPDPSRPAAPKTAT